MDRRGTPDVQHAVDEPGAQQLLEQQRGQAARAAADDLLLRGAAPGDDLEVGTEAVVLRQVGESLAGEDVLVLRVVREGAHAAGGAHRCLVDPVEPGLVDAVAPDGDRDRARRPDRAGAAPDAHASFDDPFDAVRHAAPFSAGPALIPSTPCLEGY
ncbi:hypothetical protein GCM10025870_19600 [Agromyces marinus]|uniref:Uncharacterized protein n=1 Tax=Agromyces marinus TaxID=1389020 RepID=A0ABM8H2B9_9MICO|nr:hypothetical protein GCM10025870_19600 [Agromyces marinus]